MDYALAIRRNRDQLRTIVRALFALARMRVGGSLFFLPCSTFAMIMLILRPAKFRVCKQRQQARKWRVLKGP